MISNPFVRALLLVCWMAVAWLAPQAGSADEVPHYVFSEATPTLLFDRGVQTLEDPQQRWQLRDAVTREDWQLSHPGQILWPYVHHAVWQRVVLENGSNVARPLFLEIGSAGNDQLSLWIKREGYPWQTLMTVNKGRFVWAGRDLRFPAAQLRLDAGEKVDLVWRARTDGWLMLPVTVYTEQAFNRQLDRGQLFMGVLVGILVVMACYNLFLFFATRDKACLYYVFFTLANLLYQLSWTGLGGVYVWPGAWADGLQIPLFRLSPALAFIAAMLFVIQFLDVRVRYPRLYSAAWLMMAGWLVYGISWALDFYFVSDVLGQTLSPLTCALAIYIGIREARRSRVGFYFALAWILLVASTMVHALMMLGWVPRNELVTSLQQLGTIAETVLLSLALGEQINQARKDRLLARQEIVRVQSAATAKSEFLASMSHEIRSPLNGVIGMAELLRTTPLNMEQRHLVQTMNQAGQTLINVVNDILDFSKLEAGKLDLSPHVFSLNAVLDECFSLFAARSKEKGLMLVQRIDPGLPAELRGDSHRLRQIIINFLSNACKFTEAGSITVTVQAASSTHLRFAVRDTGIGLSAPQQAKLFQAYAQADASTARHYGGTGLGLMICKQLAQLMQGDIGVNSSKGQGAEFWFTACLETVSVTRPTANRVLVWGPDPEVQNVVLPLLRRLQVPFKMVSQTTGQTAIQKQLSSAETFDPDMATPDSGWEPFYLIQCGEAPADIESVIRVYRKLIPAARQIVVYRQKPEGGASSGRSELALPLTHSMLSETLDNLTGDKNAAVSGEVSLQGYPGVHALLVDDTPTNLLVLKGLLKRHGITTEAADNGKAAVMKLLAGTRFDLVFMDCEMPEMDGFAATESIRALQEHQQLDYAPWVVGLSGHAQDEYRQRALASGMNDYAVKPITQTHLAGLLAKALQSPPG